MGRGPKSQPPFSRCSWQACNLTGPAGSRRDVDRTELETVQSLQPLGAHTLCQLKAQSIFSCEAIKQELSLVSVPDTGSAPQGHPLI